MSPSKCIIASFLLVQTLFLSATVSGFDCWACDASSNEECIANRVLKTCMSTVCTNMNVSLLNTATGKTSINVVKGCGFPGFCNQEKFMCDNQNQTKVKAPMKMLACSFSCCTSGPDCVNVTDERPSNTSTTPTVLPTSPTVLPTSTFAPTTKLQTAFTASPWATDMSLCKPRCCGGTPAQIWQNRTCCPVRTGGCLEVELAREVKCEDTYCNQKHCGACQLGQKTLMIMIAAIMFVVYDFLH